MMPKAKFNELSSVIDSIKMVSSTEFLVNDRGTYLTADGHGQKLRIDRSKTNIYPFVELHEILYSILHTKQKFLYYHTEKFDHYSDTQKLTESLSEANTGEGTWDPGWEITNIEENGQELAVQRDGLTLWVFPNEIFVEENESSVGKNCYIKIGKEFRDLLPGFYMAIGNATNNYNLENVVRIYWNITTEGAIKLTKNLTTELNLMNIPFRFKILKDPYAFSRVDAAVLYINKEYLTTSRKSLSKVYHIVGGYLNCPTPVFAKELAPGLALAESPRNSHESFGENRCRILAEAIYETCKSGVMSSDAKLSEVIKYFAKLGIDLNRAYINPNSVDDYDILLSGAFVYD